MKVQRNENTRGIFLLINEEETALVLLETGNESRASVERTVLFKNRDESRNRNKSTKKNPEPQQLNYRFRCRSIQFNSIQLTMAKRQQTQGRVQ